MKQLFFSFVYKKIRVVKQIPKLDLGLVLKVFTGNNVEPMRSSSLEHLTYTTIFLISLATGARRGELLALRRGADFVKVFLYPDPEFVPKARRTDARVDAIELA